MTTYVDASVIVAILSEEADYLEQAVRLQDATKPICSAITIWEATVALTRRLNQSVTSASRMVDELLTVAKITLVNVGADEAFVAVAAYDQFGKGRHKAHLNMGDCFAYACAKANGAEFLYKGDDFTHTDLA